MALLLLSCLAGPAALPHTCQGVPLLLLLLLLGLKPLLLLLVRRRTPRLLLRRLLARLRSQQLPLRRCWQALLHVAGRWGMEQQQHRLGRC